MSTCTGDVIRGWVVGRGGGGCRFTAGGGAMGIGWWQMPDGPERRRGEPPSIEEKRKNYADIVTMVPLTIAFFANLLTWFASVKYHPASPNIDPGWVTATILTGVGSFGFAAIGAVGTTASQYFKKPWEQRIFYGTGAIGVLGALGYVFTNVIQGIGWFVA